MRAIQRHYRHSLRPGFSDSRSLGRLKTGSPWIGVWQRFLAWDDFLRLGLCGGCIAGVYPRRILAAANGRPQYGSVWTVRVLQPLVPMYRDQKNLPLTWIVLLGPLEATLLGAKARAPRAMLRPEPLRTAGDRPFGRVAETNCRPGVKNTGGSGRSKRLCPRFHASSPLHEEAGGHRCAPTAFCLTVR